MTRERETYQAQPSPEEVRQMLEADPALAQSADLETVLDWLAEAVASGAVCPPAEVLAVLDRQAYELAAAPDASTAFV
jgi:hypothetical protein